MGKPKVFLFSTPLSLIPALLLGVPVLQGYLINNGLECNSSDFNIRFLQWLINDRTLLDGFAAKAVGDFEEIQKKPALNQNEAIKLIHIAAALSAVPPKLMEKHMGSKAVLGTSKPALSTQNPWEDYMPCWAVALSSLGFMPNDTGSGVSELQAAQNRQTCFGEFLNTKEAREILQRAIECDVIGISAPFWLQQKEYVYILAKEIRRLNPKTFIIIGGSGVSIMAEYSIDEIRDSGVIDAVGLYQGELTLKVIAECLANGEDLEAVPDIILFNHNNGTYIKTEHMPVIHPDLMPTPVFNSDEVDMYQKLAGQDFPDKRAPLLISRGCYWDKCAFCSDRLCRHPSTSPHEVRKPEKVLDDIQQLQKQHNISYFYLITSAMSPSWGKKFARGIIERGIKARFWTYMRAVGKEAADSEYFELLKEAGFDMITVGVESTVDRVLTAISKGNNRTEITNTIQGLSKAGVRTKFNLIADLPPSKYEDAKSNYEYVLENIQYIDNLSVFTFLLHLGSEMADNPEKFNIKTATDKDGKNIELYPGTILHTNPFYEHNKAKEIVKRTKNLSNDVQFYQLTKKLRNTMDNKAFSWNTASIVFEPFTAVKSSFPLFDLRQRDVYLVFLNNMFNYIVIPAEFEDFLKLYKQGVKEPVAFKQIWEAFESGLAAYSLKSRVAKRESLAERLIDRMAREGFIKNITGTEAVEAEQAIVPVKFDAVNNLSRTFERYPYPELPFAFGTFPFAMVPSTLMV